MVCWITVLPITTSLSCTERRGVVSAIFGYKAKDHNYFYNIHVVNYSFFHEPFSQHSRQFILSFSKVFVA